MSHEGIKKPLEKFSRGLIKGGGLSLGSNQSVLSRQAVSLIEKWQFSYWYTYPDIALIRLQTTNSIRKSSGNGLAYD